MLQYSTLKEDVRYDLGPMVVYGMELRKERPVGRGSGIVILLKPGQGQWVGEARGKGANTL